MRLRCSLAAVSQERCPWSNFVIKALFYVVPFLLAVAATGTPTPAYRPVNFVLSILFLLANASHVIITAMRATDVITYAQVLLLIAVLAANLQLCRVSRRWWRPTKSETDAPTHRS